MRVESRADLMTQRLQICVTLPLPVELAFSRLADHQPLDAALGLGLRHALRKIGRAS